MGAVAEVSNSVRVYLRILFRCSVRAERTLRRVRRTRSRYSIQNLDPLLRAIPVLAIVCGRIMPSLSHANE